MPGDSRPPRLLFRGDLGIVGEEPQNVVKMLPGGVVARVAGTYVWG